jgi:hypothetical protein
VPSLAYPPSDLNLYEFFEKTARAENDTPALERKYFAFFAGLFACAVDELGEALKRVSDKQMTIPQRWHEYLADGATGHAVGNERERFYDKVVDKAQKVGVYIPNNDGKSNG